MPAEGRLGVGAEECQGVQEGGQQRACTSVSGVEKIERERQLGTSQAVCGAAVQPGQLNSIILLS